jgi:hypothetical protein
MVGGSGEYPEEEGYFLFLSRNRAISSLPGIFTTKVP